jgi:serine/threonine protein phosphatase 1
MVEEFERVFIGHTSCFRLDKGNPVWAGGVINLDTGAGWNGVLTIMDVDTEEYWQSDNVRKLYPNTVGR